MTRDLPRHGIEWRRANRALGIGAALLVAVPTGLAAQWRSTIGFGGALRSDARDELRTAPIITTGRLEYEGARLALDVQGSWSGSDLGRFSTAEIAGRVAARLQSPAARGLRLVLAPSAERTRLSDAVQRERLSFVGGVSWAHDGLTLRAVGGRSAVAVGRVPERTTDFELELRRRIGSAALTFASRGTSWRDSAFRRIDTVYYVAGFPFTGSTTRAYNRARGYVDAEVSAQWWLGFVQVHARAGARGLGEATFAARWAGVRLSAPVANRLAITAEARRDPGSPELGLRDRNVAVLGLEVMSAAARRPARERRARLRERDAEMRVEVVAAVDGRRSILIRGLTGRRVELMGDVTNWAAVLLEPQGPGAWRASVDVRPGVHHLLVRVDGGDWRPPPTLPSARHEFGTVGVLFVEP